MMPRREISKEDAHKRAVEDYSQFCQFSRNSAQFSFYANGGAAGAILTFLTAITTASNQKIDTPSIVQSFAIACSFYLCGALLSVAAMFLLSVSKRNWGHAWEDTTSTGIMDFDSYFARRGDKFQFRGELALILSALAFLCGSVSAVAGFFRQGFL